MSSIRGTSLPPPPSSSAPATGMPSTTSTTLSSGHAARPSMADRSFTSFAGSSSSSLSALGFSNNINGHGHGHHHHYQSSSSGIDSPVASNSATNRTANGAYGLYQTCLSLRSKLERVPGYAERYLEDDNNSAGLGASGGSSSIISHSNNDETLLPSPLSPTIPTSSSSAPSASVLSTSTLPTAAEINDPVSQICKSLRLGSSLCYIFNMLNPEKRLDVNPDANPLNFKACQRAAAHFVMACRTQLGWNDNDIFRISELYSPDTNGTVKVINTVSKFINMLEERGLLLPPQEAADQPETTAQNGALDGRGNVVRELLMTERKYVQDLEVLQEYARKLSDEQILSQDTIHNLFLNLNSIVDFARRFLIGVEANASLPPEQQRFGSLFLLMEDSFTVYEPYCINYLKASELAATVTKSETAALQRLSHILEPNELLMFHIKPVQRLLKYHLLFESLAKATDSSWPYYSELVAGADTAKRIADKVNEETRKQENKQSVEELRGRVEDWKGHELSSFGELLLHETFQVLKSEVEREYHVYLFQKIVLCCKDAPLPGGKTKVNKSNSMIRKSGTPAGAAGQKPKKPMLQLKGRIFINNVISAVPHTKPGSYLLQITWRGDQLDEAFSIKCRTPEQLTQWHKTVTKAVEEMAAQRRSRSAGQLRRLASPHSQFPNTPQSELGPMIHGFGGSSASLHSTIGYGSNPCGGTFEDEDNDYNGEYEPSTGRSTPNLGMDRSIPRRGAATQSLPPGARQNGEAGGSRPRAQTEDSNSAVINQWRSQTPSGGYPSVPSLPRHTSMSSSATSVSPHDGLPPTLRHSASKPALRTKQSQEWSNPPPSGTGSSGSSTATYTPALNNGQTAQSLGQQMDELSLHGGEPLRMLRQNSQGNMPIHNAPPPLRSRSASSPHVYQLTPGQQSQLQNEKQWWPYPIQDVHPAHFAAAHMGRQMSNGQNGMPPLKRNLPGNSSTATIASTAGSSTTVPLNRLSTSSTSTDRSSGDSSQSQGLAYISPTSSVTATPAPHVARSYQSPETPMGMYPPHSEAPLSPSSAVKVKVNYGEDTFVIVVLSTITYIELVKKVLHKIHLCGARTNGLDASTLRLKYEDEEGDKILITADDDIAMAFDWLRSMGGPANSLLVYAE